MTALPARPSGSGAADAAAATHVATGRSDAPDAAAALHVATGRSDAPDAAAAPHVATGRSDAAGAVVAPQVGLSGDGATGIAAAPQVDTSDDGAEDALRVGRYRLVPLRQVRCDDVAAWLGPGPHAFVCNFPEDAWYAHARRPRRMPMAERRKRAMWARLGDGAPVLSMTRDEAGWATARDVVGPDGIVHLGDGGLPGGAGRVWQAARLTAALWARRRQFRDVVVYNLDQPQCAAAWAFTRAARRRLVLDYEDDPTLLPRAAWKNTVARWMRGRVDAAICIHPRMQAAFVGRPSCVASSFAALGYAAAADFSLREGMSFIYAGRLDDVRGATLLPELVAALRRRLRRFTVHVAGAGPAAAWLRARAPAELRLHGVLAAPTLAALIRRCDACLVLQLPDHPFAAGCFPSKIEAYAAEQRPIFTLAVAA